MAKRVLAAVRRRKRKLDSWSESEQPEELTSEVDILDPEYKLPKDLTRTQKLDMLVRVLSKFVGDTPEQKGSGEQTVWDVSLSAPL